MKRRRVSRKRNFHLRRSQSTVLSLLLLAGVLALPLLSSPARAATPTLMIVSPADCAVLGNGTPVIVRFLVSGFFIVQTGRVGEVAGLKVGHLQLLVDGSVLEELGQVEPAFLVSLPAGDHDLTMRLVNSDDTPLTPDVSATTNFHVTASTSATLPLVLNGGVLFLEVFIVTILILRRRKEPANTSIAPRDEL